MDKYFLEYIKKSASQLYWKVKQLPYRVGAFFSYGYLASKDLDFFFEEPFLKLLKLKAKRQKEAIIESQNFVGWEKTVREIDILISHIDHFLNIDDFIKYPEGYKEWLRNTINTYDVVNNKGAVIRKGIKDVHPKKKYFTWYTTKHIPSLEKYHWECIWQMLKNKSGKWWT